jgi:hypothetical protein
MISSHQPESSIGNEQSRFFALYYSLESGRQTTGGRRSCGY